MSVSVRKVNLVAWAFMWLLVTLTIVPFLLLAFLSDCYNWPPYVTILGIFLLPLPTFIGGLYLLEPRVSLWAYMNVDDVHELDSAPTLVSFDSLQEKYPEKYAAIMQRYAEYTFVDDASIPTETAVFYRRPWQSGIFISLSLSFLFMLGLISKNITLVVLAPVGVLFMFLAVRKARKLADRGPQLVVNNEHLCVHKKVIPWAELNSYKVIEGKVPRLTYETGGLTQELQIEDLACKALRLNHLLHIYSRRHRRDHPSLYYNK